jgi:hypothetical protein
MRLLTTYSTADLASTDSKSVGNSSGMDEDHDRGSASAAARMSQSSTEPVTKRLETVTLLVDKRETRFTFYCCPRDPVAVADIAKVSV